MTFFKTSIINNHKSIAFLIFLTCFLLLGSLLSAGVSAQIGIVGGGLGTGVSATIGNFYLNLSGWASPFASVTLTSDGVTLRTTTADQNGNFYISEVLIKQGFSHFCLESTDFRHLGSSITCFSITPATGSVTINDIFLPPTLALSKTEIPAGGTIFAFGFTMPGALVTLYLSPPNGEAGNGETLTTRADSLGYYRFAIKNLKAGKYTLYARAQYKNKKSFSPSKALQLTSLTLLEQFIEFLKYLFQRLLAFLSSLALGPLWLVIPIIILIIILIFKLWPGRFTFITSHMPRISIPVLPKRHHHPLHHSWWVGY